MSLGALPQGASFGNWLSHTRVGSTMLLPDAFPYPMVLSWGSALVKQDSRHHVAERLTQRTPLAPPPRRRCCGGAVCHKSSDRDPDEVLGRHRQHDAVRDGFELRGGVATLADESTGQRPGQVLGPVR